MAGLMNPETGLADNALFPKCTMTQTTVRPTDQKWERLDKRVGSLPTIREGREKVTIDEQKN